MQEHRSIALSWDFQKSLLEFGTQILQNPLYTFHFFFFPFNLLFLDMGKGPVHFVGEGYYTMFGISIQGWSQVREPRGAGNFCSEGGWGLVEPDLAFNTSPVEC